MYFKEAVKVLHNQLKSTYPTPTNSKTNIVVTKNLQRYNQETNKKQPEPKKQQNPKPKRSAIQKTHNHAENFKKTKMIRANKSSELEKLLHFYTNIPTYLNSNNLFDNPEDIC